MTDRYSELLEKTYRSHIPLSAHVELTYRCNLNCVHCYANRRNQPGELSTSEVIAALDSLAAMGTLFAVFTGGEILMRPDLRDILLAARARQFAIRLFTNATKVDQGFARFLGDEIAPTSVDISLYAMTPALHDQITGHPGSHSLTRAGIEYCVSAGLPVRIKTILMRSNVAEYDAVRAYCAGLGATYAVDFQLAPCDSGDSLMPRLGLTGEELSRFIAGHRPAGAPPPEEPPHPAKDAPLCGAGSNTICITPDGTVLPCLAMRNHPLGNLRTTPLPEIWRSPALDLLRNARYNDVTECVNCGLAGYCSKCPAIAEAESGSLLGVSPTACMIAEATRNAHGVLPRTCMGK